MSRVESPSLSLPEILSLPQNEFFSQFFSAIEDVSNVRLVIQLRRLLPKNSNTLIDAIRSIEDIDSRNGAYVLLVKLVKEKWDFLDVSALLEEVTPDSSQLYGSVCHELADYYYMAVFDNSDCAEGNSGTSLLFQNRLSFLLKAVNYAVDAYMRDKTDERLELCLRIVHSYWAMTEDTVSRAEQVDSCDSRDEIFRGLLKKGGKSSSVAIIEWVKQMRHIDNLNSQLDEKDREIMRLKEQLRKNGALFSDRDGSSSDDDYASGFPRRG